MNDTAGPCTLGAALHPRKAVRSLAFGSAWAQVNWFTDCETAFSTEKSPRFETRALRFGILETLMPQLLARRDRALRWR